MMMTLITMMMIITIIIMGHKRGTLWRRNQWEGSGEDRVLDCEQDQNMLHIYMWR
jgi:hypothetical protein